MSANPDATAGARSSTTLMILLHDGHGALERVLGAARRQGCAITNLAFEPAARSGLARLRLTVHGGQPARLARQLARLVDVVEVHDTAPAAAADIAALSDILSTPFRFQADGASPGESEAETPKTLTEE
jgi:acetolactate synthase regulatory subunit